ncbi:PIG-L deacetylase family protein [Neptuniibacter sp. QD48_11]|uniref:PIG-L deacetylase family protein n=1 Tax=unclassified Neptuniibacter TaxID=2630693 RepID=UPI0039F4890C
MTVLVVAAHPDDEVLGCGGTIAKYVSEGRPVKVMFIADGVSSRSDSAADSALPARLEALEAASVILGYEVVFTGQLPDNRLDTVPLLEIVQLIERYISQLRPHTVITHHSGDLNIDHRLVHEAVVTACRPTPGHSVKNLLFFEVASSTEWRSPGDGYAFAPNYFVDISGCFLKKKQEALLAYQLEMREWPHPRSAKAIDALCHWRGATVGVEAAEAYILGRMLA